MQIDVHEYFMDARGWTEFYAYLSEMPSHSRFKSAMSMDEDLARSQVAGLSQEQIDEILSAKADQDDKDPDIPLEEYTIQIEKLNQIIDKIGILNFTVRSALSSKGSQGIEFKPAPRPKTAIQKELDKRIYEAEREEARSLQRELGF